MSKLARSRASVCSDQSRCSIHGESIERSAPDQHQPGSEPVGVQTGEHGQDGLEVLAGGPRADPADGGHLDLGVGGEGLAGRVHAARHDLDAAGVARACGQVGVAGDHQPRAAQARLTAPRLLLGPLEAAVDGGGRTEEQRVIEVVGIQVSGGSIPGNGLIRRNRCTSSSSCPTRCTAARAALVASTAPCARSRRGRTAPGTRPASGRRGSPAAPRGRPGRERSWRPAPGHWRAFSG